MNEFDYAGTENWCGCRVELIVDQRAELEEAGRFRIQDKLLDGYVHVPPFRLLDTSVLLRTESSRFPARLFAYDFPVGVRFVEKIR